MIIFDSDDFGSTHEISNMCQSHDCRDVLIALHELNPKFKATLFAIPGEMTLELLSWCKTNRDWVRIAVHGFFHSSNYECEKMTYDDFDFFMRQFKPIIEPFFEKGFKAPGWQISDDIYRWLLDNDWWVADQPFNIDKRPDELKAYEVGDNSIHTHVWNCVGNGVYELYDELVDKVSKETEFKFVSEVINEN